jgi:hypothetical protein
MDALKRYDALFSRLIFDRGFRDQVRAGDWSAMGDAADAFNGVDLVKLEKLATDIRDGLIRGSLGVPGVGAAFPQTIAVLGGGAEAVADRFLADHYLAEDIDGTGRRAGVSPLESFFDWASGQLAGQPAALGRAQHELAAALVAALARTPRPGFLVHWPLLRPGPRGWCCVLDTARPLQGPDDRPDHPVAYLGLDSRYAAGSVTESMAAAVMETADAPPPWAADLARADPEATATARRALEDGTLLA